MEEKLEEKFRKMDEKMLRNNENRFRCKFCKVQFDEYKKYWYHQKKCNVDPKSMKKLDDITKKLENETRIEVENELKIEVENEDKSIKNIDDIINIEPRYIGILDRIQSLSKKMKTEIIDLRYEEKMLDRILKIRKDEIEIYKMK